MSHECEISTQHSLARNRAARLQRRVEAVLRPQFCQGQRGGEQLHVRSRDEILVCVLLVQRLAALRAERRQVFRPGFEHEAGTKYLSAFCSYSVSPLSASTMSSTQTSI